MIAGVGLDICPIARMEESLKNEHFAQRVFTAAERDYFATRPAVAAHSAAACFAAKEALSKALGCGIGPVAFDEISVEHDENGAPYYRLSGKAKRLCEERNISGLHLSLTHDAG